MIRRNAPPPITEEQAVKGFDSFELRLGDILRGERATLGKSLLDVQRELKIKATYISAIEATDLKVFDTPSFVAGYVRSYARYLGVDPDETYRQFCHEAAFKGVHGMEKAASGTRVADAVQKQPGRQKAKDDTDLIANPKAPFAPAAQSAMWSIEPGAIGSSVILLALIGVLGFGAYSVLMQVQKVTFAPIEQSPGVVAQLDPLTSTVAEVGLGEVNKLGVPTVDVMDRLYRPEALDVPVLVARDGPIASIRPEFTTPAMITPDALETQFETPLETQADAIQLALNEANGVQVLESDGDQVAFLAVRPAWVQVKSADGTVLFEKIMNAGEKYVAPKTELPPILKVGESGAIYFTVGDKTYGPAGSRGAVSSNIALEQVNLVEKYALADPDSADMTMMKTVAEVVVGN